MNTDRNLFIQVENTNRNIFIQVQNNHDVNIIKNIFIHYYDCIFHVIHYCFHVRSKEIQVVK